MKHLSHKIYTAFTLVELLVVITILSILGTIGTLVFLWNIAEARDAARNNDLVEITNVLHLYESEFGEYPIPSENVEITFSWALAWNQWVFWESVGKEVRKFGSDIPTDPKYGNYYSYSVTPKQNEFQVWSIKEKLKQEEDENLWELVTFTFGEVQAASIETSMILWDYNGFMVLARNGSTNYFVATPSIIATDISTPDAGYIISNQKLVYDRFFNLPASYGEFMDVEWGFNFNVSDPLVFSGSLNDLKSEQQLLDFSENLKYIYATTPTESFDTYISLLEKDGLTSLKWFLTRKFKIAFRTYFNCKDILDDGLSQGSRMYEIDPDGEQGEPAYMVYCDMETDGWGWTQIGENYAENWDFSGGTWVVGAFEYTNEENTIVPLSPQIEDNAFALRQTWNYSTYYKIPFPDNDLLKPGYELRMTLWRSDYSDETDTSEDEVSVMWWKYSRWTVGTCTSGSSCFFQNLNRKLLHAQNNGDPWLSNIDITVKNRLWVWQSLTSDYLENGVLFDGFIPSAWSRDGWSQDPYSTVEKEVIDEWIQAGGFLISTNNEDDYDPLGEYFGMPTLQYTWQSRWKVEDIDHPLVNGTLALKQNLRNEELQGQYARAVLWWTILPDDTIIARDFYAPHDPTVLLRKHGKWYILFVADDGMFMNVSSASTFQANDNESVLAAAIIAFGIEKAAGINPREGYAFHNRIYYSDGTFSINGAEDILETITVDDNGTPRVWVKEQVRHTVLKTPENFDWYLGLDANNNKDLYFTGLELELFYR